MLLFYSALQQSSKATPTNDTNYSCHIKAVELVEPFTLLFINNFRGGHTHARMHAHMHTRTHARTHTHTHNTHTNAANESNFKKLGMKAGAPV